jgi:hypothetical protein
MRSGPLASALDEWARFENLLALGNRARHTLAGLSMDRLVNAAAADLGSERTPAGVIALAARVRLLLDTVECGRMVPEPCSFLDDLDTHIIARW